jgi:hypothetical protein
VINPAEESPPLDLTDLPGSPDALASSISLLQNYLILTDPINDSCVSVFDVDR